MSACSGLLDKVLALSIARFAKQTSEAWRLLSKTKNTIFSRTAYTAGLGVSMSQRTLPSNLPGQIARGGPWCCQGQNMKHTCVCATSGRN